MNRLLPSMAFLLLLQTGGGSPPCLVHLESLEYPGVARSAHIEGEVVLRVQISASGQVKSVEKLRGNDLLATEATKNLGKWIFAPGAPANLDVRYEFKLVEPPAYYRVPPTIIYDLPGHVQILQRKFPIIKD